MLTTPLDPESISLEFARQLSPNENFVYVPVIPTTHAVPAECYSNVDAAVEADGGLRLLGWQIWEWPGIFAEAEAHAVWQHPDGRLYDVTPKEETSILFIPDPSLRFEGDRINNIRQALLDTEVVHDFIEAGNLKHSIFGSLPVGLKLEQWQLLIGQKLEFVTTLLPHLFGKNGKSTQRCPCKSGVPYNECHRLEIRRTLEIARKLSEEPQK